MADRRTLPSLDAAVSISVRQQTRAALATLTPRERRVLRVRFGIGETGGATLAAAGPALLLTHEEIACIEARALRKLRYPSRIVRLNR
ncbi:MAG: sigma factor-like helix-turn-helix DNA-binding protein [Candidatus Binatia bacterium]